MIETRIENDVNMDTRFIDGVTVNLTYVGGSEQPGMIDAVYPLFIVFIGLDCTVNLVPWTSILNITSLGKKKTVKVE